MTALTRKQLVEVISQAAGDSLIIVSGRPVHSVTLASGWLVDGYFSKVFKTGEVREQSRVRARGLQFTSVTDSTDQSHLTKDALLAQIADMPDDAVIVVDGGTVMGVSITKGWIQDLSSGARFTPVKPREKNRTQAWAIQFTSQTEDSDGHVRNCAV